MATNNNNDSSNNSFVRSLLGLTPVGVAAYAGYKDLTTSNATKKIISSNNPISELGKKIGEDVLSKVKKKKVSREKLDLQNEDFLRNILSKADGITDLLKSVEDKNAVLQSLSLALDDPAMGIEDDARVTLKSQIQQAALGSTTDGEKIVRDILTALKDSGTTSIKARFSQNMQVFSEVGKSLTTPISDIPLRGVAYNPIPATALGKRNLDYINQLQAALGKRFSVKAATYQESGERFSVLQVFEKKKEGDRFRGSVPLEGSMYRAGGSGRTTYALPKGVMDLREASDLLSGRKVQPGKKRTLPVSSPHSFFQSEFLRRAQSGYVDFADYNAWQSSYMTYVDRIGSDKSAYGEHVRSQARTQTNAMAFSNIEALGTVKNQQEAIAKLASTLPHVFNAGIANKRLLSRSEEGLMGNLGLKKGSLFERLQDLWGASIDRKVLPITMREHQLLGRSGAFVGGSTDLGNTGFKVGSVLSNIEEVMSKQKMSFIDAARSVDPLADMVSGGLATPVLIDVRGDSKLSTGTASSGMAFTGKKRTTRNPMNLGILDPKAHGYLQSDLLDRIIKAGDKGITLSGDDLKTASYIGETSSGSRFLSFSDSTKEVFLKMAEVTEDAVGGGSKKIISISGYEDVEQDMFKVFSMTHKGNVQLIDDTLSVFEGDSKDFVESLLKTKGIDKSDLIVTGSDMLGKGGFGLMYQIGQSTRLLSDGKVSLKDLQSRADLISSKGSKFGNAFKGEADESLRAIGSYAQAALELMTEKNIPADQIGMVLSGAYYGVEGTTSKKGKYGLERATLLDLGSRVLQGKGTAEFERGIKSGTVLSYDIQALGPSQGDWGKARAGIEPRFAKTLQERLLGMGLGVDESSSIVSKIYQNKIGIGEHYSLASQLLDMTSSTSGTRTALDYLSNSSTKKVGYSEFLTEMLNSKDGNLSSLMDSTPGGMLLNLDDAPSPIRNAAKKVFGQTEVYFPGQEAMEAAKGTVIKGANGFTTKVDSELGQILNSFQERLSVSDPDYSYEDSFREWRGRSDKFFLGVFDQLHAGKIKGGISPTVALYDLTQGTNFGSNGKMLQRAREVFFASKGQSVFQTAESFATQIMEMKENSPTEELSWKARQFFTAMESDKVSKWKGLVGIGGRHPIMTSGSVFVEQSFRHLGEISSLGGEDDFFKRISGSEPGKKILEKAFGRSNISSFAEVSKFGKKEQITFFDEFVKNIESFSTGQSSDKAFYPTLKTTQGDIGIGVQAFADMDGDHTFRFLLDKDSGERLMGEMRKRGDVLALEDFQQRSFFNAVNRETKGALENVATKLMGQGGISVQDRIYQDTLKEINLSINTGSLDVSLRGIHDAVLMYEPDPKKKAMARAVLGNIQENFILKSKKLPVLTDYPERIQDVSKRIMSGVDFQNNMDDFTSLMREIYENQKISTTGITIDQSLEVIDSADSVLKDQFERFKKMQGMNESFMYHLDDFLGTVSSSARSAIENNTNLGGTKGQLSALLEYDPEEAMRSIKGSKTLNSQGLTAFAERPKAKQVATTTSTLLSNIRANIGLADARMTKYGVAGVGASVLAMALLNNNVDSEPMSMIEENVDASVMDNIRNGNVFEEDVTIDPQSLLSTDSGYPQNIMEAKSMYANRPNSYQIRGNVSTGTGLSNFSSYFSQLTGGQGKGIISINDNRMPITQNYVDRLLGEY